MQQGIPQTKRWKRPTGKEYDTTLPVYIRNAIHHPENSLNPDFTENELRQSIKHLVAVVESINRAKEESGLSKPEPVAS